MIQVFIEPKPASPPVYAGYTAHGVTTSGHGPTPIHCVAHALERWLLWVDGRDLAWLENAGAAGTLFEKGGVQ